MLDQERLAFLLLRKSAPDLTIAPQVEVDSIDDLPLVTFTARLGGAVSGGSPPMAWDGVLDLTVYADSMDGARELAGQMYDLVWAWDNPFGTLHTIPSLGHVSEIEDQSPFSRTGTFEVAMGRSITQYDGSFGLQFHRA